LHIIGQCAERAELGNATVTGKAGRSLDPAKDGEGTSTSAGFAEQRHKGGRKGSSLTIISILIRFPALIE
jgi:hypothetical protein